MIDGQQQFDLFVLVADLDMAETVSMLLDRPEGLSIDSIKYVVVRDLQRDPGCRAHAAARLRPFASSYRHALVMFDREGCGHEYEAREGIQREVE